MTITSTKRVSGDYAIYTGANVAGTYTGTLRVYGNLDIVGTTTTVESTNTVINDRIITLNNGELGAGVTTGSPPSAGVEVDRGSSPKVAIRWNETAGDWQATKDGSTYLTLSYGVSLAGSDTQVIYNDSGTAFGANVNFTYNKTTNTLTAGGVVVNNYTISTNVTNQNLVLDPNGTGQLVVNAAMKLANQGSAPSPSAGNTHIYSNTPSAGGSGVFYVNNTDSGELTSKLKARKLALIF